MRTLTAIDLAVGAFTASRIADLIAQAVAPAGVPRERGVFRTRERSAYARQRAEYFIKKEEFVEAGRCARGIDPFCPFSDPESELYRAAIEAARYVRQLRWQHRALKVAALAVCADKAELLLGPIGVDHGACRAIAREALTEIGHPARYVI